MCGFENLKMKNKGAIINFGGLDFQILKFSNFQILNLPLLLNYTLF
jgi:hypothetical protein